MSIGTVEYTQNDELKRIDIESLPELDKTLDRLIAESKEPTLVSVLNLKKDSLAIGVGHKETILSFVKGDGDPPYYISLGNPNLEGIIAFNYGGQESEFPAKYLIPMEKGREAVKHFLASGKLDHTVNWVED